MDQFIGLMVIFGIGALFGFVVRHGGAFAERLRTPVRIAGELPIPKLEDLTPLRGYLDALTTIQVGENRYHIVSLDSAGPMAAYYTDEKLHYDLVRTKKRSDLQFLMDAGKIVVIQW